MTETPWTYHEFHYSPRRKTYSIMEGIRTFAACSREKDARLIVSMKETNAELLEALKSALGAVEFMAGAIDSDPEDHENLAVVLKAIAKAKS